MICNKCGDKMTLLFQFYSCDFCEGGVKRPGDVTDEGSAIWYFWTIESSMSGQPKSLRKNINVLWTKQGIKDNWQAYEASQWVYPVFYPPRLHQSDDFRGVVMEDKEVIFGQAMHVKDFIASV